MINRFLFTSSDRRQFSFIFYPKEIRIGNLHDRVYLILLINHFGNEVWNYSVKNILRMPQDAEAYLNRLMKNIQLL